jgi:succinate dehydrogenase flavin-adding protein (antitoxin of CptAB toxin-antitoxin module)
LILEEAVYNREEILKILGKEDKELVRILQTFEYKNYTTKDEFSVREANAIIDYVNKTEQKKIVMLEEKKGRGRPAKSNITKISEQVLSGNGYEEEEIGEFDLSEEVEKAVKETQKEIESEEVATIPQESDAELIETIWGDSKPKDDLKEQLIDKVTINILNAKQTVYKKGFDDGYNRGFIEATEEFQRVLREYYQ